MCIFSSLVFDTLCQGGHSIFIVLSPLSALMQDEVASFSERGGGGGGGQKLSIRMEYTQVAILSRKLLKKLDV